MNLTSVTEWIGSDIPESGTDERTWVVSYMFHGSAMFTRYCQADDSDEVLKIAMEHLQTVGYFIQDIPEYPVGKHRNIYLASALQFINILHIQTVLGEDEDKQVKGPFFW